MINQEMRIKVMSLGNRLALRMSGDRKAAFKQAWAIVKAGVLEITVKGVSFGNRQEALKRLARYNPSQIKAVFIPESTNPVDPSAVAVHVGVQNGKGLFHLGYVPRNFTAIASILGNHFNSMRIVSGTWGWKGKTTYGARIALAV